MNEPLKNTGWTDPTTEDEYSVQGGFQEERTLNEETGEWKEEVVDWTVPVLFVLSYGLEDDGENYPQIEILPILKDALFLHSNTEGGLDPRAHKGFQNSWPSTPPTRG